MINTRNSLYKMQRFECTIGQSSYSCVLVVCNYTVGQQLFLVPTIINLKTLIVMNSVISYTSNILETSFITFFFLVPEEGPE